MKKVLALSLVLLAAIVLVSACVTLVPFNSSAERVIEFEGVDQDTLFTLTGEFLAAYIRDSRVANEFLDKEGGKIVGDIFLPLYADIFIDSSVLINYNFTVRDGKVRAMLLPKETEVVRKNVYGAAIAVDTFSGISGSGDNQVLQQQAALEHSYEKFFTDYEAAILELMDDDF